MKTIAFAAALLLTAGVATASPYAASSEFTDAKTGFIVRVSEHGDKMVLDGRHPGTGETFHLAVTPEGAVRGTWASQPVSYVIPKATLSR